MTVTPGTGLLSQGIERGEGRLMRSRELTRGWRPSRLAGRTGAGGVGEQVAGAGEQLAGDRGGGDLGAAAAGDRLVAGGEVGMPPGLLRGLAQDPADPDRPLPGDVPVPDGAVAAAHGRGEPGPGRQLARRGEPGDVADLGQQDQRGERADAGQLGQDVDPRVGPGVAADLGAGAGR